MLMCREVAMLFLNRILDKIHNGQDPKSDIDELIFKFDCEEFELEVKEVRLDRLEEYIEFFCISKVCEWDLFENPRVFYALLEENLEKEKWKEIKSFLDTGNVLCFFKD